MGEERQATTAEKIATANVLKNISELIKGGLFFGNSSGYVKEAIDWLEKCVSDMTPKPLAEAPKDEDEAKTEGTTDDTEPA